MRWIIVLLACSPALAQTDFDKAYDKLLAKQSAHTPTTAPAAPDRASLTKTMETLVRQADDIVDVMSEGLTSAQKADQDQRTAEKLATLIGEVEGNRLSVKLVVVDVQSREGEFLAVGEIPLPAPAQIQNEQAMMIRAAHQMHDDQIKRAKSKDYSTPEAAASAVRIATTDADKTLARNLEIVKKQSKPLKATVHLLGDKDLLKWGKGETREVAVITLDRITLDSEILTRQASRDVTYINHADIYASVGPIRRTTSWEAFAGKTGMFGSHGLEEHASTPTKSTADTSTSTHTAKKNYGR